MNQLRMSQIALVIISIAMLVTAISVFSGVPGNANLASMGTVTTIFICNLAIYINLKNKDKK